MTSLVNSRFGILVFLLFLAYVPTTAAQIAGGMNETTNTGLGGNNFIVGTVFLPSGRPVDFRLAVKLVSLSRGDILSSTDDRGQFLFSGVAAGEYTIVIDGEKDFENATQEVGVNRSRNPVPQTYTLTIRLRDRKNSDLKLAVIRSGDAGASKKALGLYKEALELAKNGDHGGAIKKLNLAVTEHPKFVNALNELGGQYMILGDLTKAEVPLRAALAVDANAFEGLVNLGIVLFRSKRYADAEPVLHNALQVKAQSAAAHFYLGRTFMAVNRADEAIKELKATTAIGEEFKEAHRLLAVLYLGKGARQRVVEELETYLKLVPNAKDADEIRTVIQHNKSPGPPPTDVPQKAKPPV